MRTLKVISGPAAGESVGIDKEVVIGREGADLTITDPQISRRHTAVRPVDDGVEIEDLGSLNGTFVNGERLSKPITLTSSGKIRIGDSDIEIEVVEDGLTQMAPAVVIADAATPPPRGSVRRVDDATPAAAAAAAASAPPPLPPRRPRSSRRPEPRARQGSPPPTRPRRSAVAGFSGRCWRPSSSPASSAARSS